MHFVLAAIGILAAVAFYIIRARDAAQAADELLDVAADVRNAARRFGFRRKANVHPVETIEDPSLAIGAIASAFLALEDLPTREQRDALQASIRKRLNLSSADAEEVAILGQWFVSECGGPDAAVARVSKKLFRLQGAEAFEPLMNIVSDTLSAGSSGLNAKQKSALDDVKRAFHIR